MPMAIESKVKVTSGQNFMHPRTRKVNGSVFFAWRKWDRRAVNTFAGRTVAKFGDPHALAVTSVHGAIQEKRQVACDEALAVALHVGDAEDEVSNKKRRRTPKQRPTRAKETDVHVLPAVVTVMMPAVTANSGAVLHGPLAMNVTTANVASKNLIEIELTVENLEYIHKACQLRQWVL